MKTKKCWGETHGKSVKNKKPVAFLIVFRGLSTCGLPSFEIDDARGCHRLLTSKAFKRECFDAIKGIMEKRGIEVNPWIDAPHGEYEER